MDLVVTEQTWNTAVTLLRDLFHQRRSVPWIFVWDEQHTPFHCTGTLSGFACGGGMEDPFLALEIFIP